MNASLWEDADVAAVNHVIRGEWIEGRDVEFTAGGRRFTTPQLDLDTLTWSRRQPGPAFDVPIAEIVDLLVATGVALARDAYGDLADAAAQMARTSTLGRRIVDNCYADLPYLFDRTLLEFQIAQELGGPEVLDGWREVVRPNGRVARVRAFPPRIVHIMAGNTPGVAASSIVRGALTKGVHLLKMPSNDLFTAPAVLRTMARVAPGHPVLRSFSAVYWRGGDAAVESHIFRPQYFDKLVAWGGDVALRSVKQYIGPGFELVAFDPKTSISLIGREAFASEASLDEVAELAAIDATPFNQGACVSSRFQFIEGDIDDIDRYCERLHRRLGVERRNADRQAARPPKEMRDEIEALRDLEPEYRVWGDADGTGLVIRSESPVDFHPNDKIVNVVPVASLADAVAYTHVATQTVGVYPFHRKAELRDLLASAGAQRVVNLGRALGAGPGIPHDGFYPLQRCMRWLNDEE